MATMPANYYSRHDPAKRYDEHLFVAGRPLQSAELNDIQKHSAYSLRGVADALFRDGDIVRDASVSVDFDTGVVTCQSGAIYIRGMVRGVPSASLTGVSMSGSVSIGIRLVDTVITSTQDAGLLDPAMGTHSYGERGAERLQVTPSWGVGVGGDTDFFPIYGITDGVLDAKDPPPNLDIFTQSLAKYDRDSAGGCYIVSGLQVRALDDVSGVQYYSLAEGRARVYGYGMDFNTSRRVPLATPPDLKVIVNEPHLSSGGTERINFDRSPGTAITAVSITAIRTVTMTHGASTGAQDLLPDTSVLSITSVVQGAVTYTPTTDYLLTAGKVNWTPAGAEPSPGSTYQVTYQYITLVTPTLVDDLGFTIDWAVAGTLVLVSYSQKLPRIDRLCLTVGGAPVWVTGVSADYNAQIPDIPSDFLAVASVYQTWDASRRVVNDGVRVVPMPVLAGIDGRMDRLIQLIAQQRLESNIHTRETGAKKGLFTDPFLDDTQRDAGTVQTAAIVNGELQLPIAATISNVSTDVTLPTTLTYTSIITLEQSLRTGTMLINPYMSFAPVPAQVTLVPSVDRWTVVDTSWASDATSRFVVGSGDQASSASTTRSILLSRSTVPAETLRQISVAYTIAGFGPGETLSSLTFDGISLPTGGAIGNSFGIVTGSFTIPAGVPAGNKRLTFVGGSGAAGFATYSGQGTIERQTWQRQTTVTETRWQSPPPPPAVWEGGGDNGGGGGGVDPLAQTFTLTANIQATAIDLWFAAKPTTTASIQIRETATGFPTQSIVAEATLQPAAINIGGASTRVTFVAPVSLIAGIEYAIVVLCNDPIGSVSVAELGKFDATAQRWITSQPYTIGVLLSSSNAVTWTAHQDRDMAFRLLRASYTQTARTVALGTVAVVGATDLMLMSYAERPASVTAVDYTLTLPDASVLTVADGQPVQLAAAITGNVTVAARLSGSVDFSPVLMPGTQLVAGIVASTGTYVSRAVPAGTGVRIKVIYEGNIPGGATVSVAYKGPDGGDVWATVTSTGTAAADDGFIEFTHEITGVTEVTVQVRLTLTGTTAARPRVRDLRVIVA